MLKILFGVPQTGFQKGNGQLNLVPEVSLLSKPTTTPFAIDAHPARCPQGSLGRLGHHSLKDCLQETTRWNSNASLFTK